MLFALKITACILFLAGGACLTISDQRVFLVGLVLVFVTAPMVTLAAILFRRIMSGIEVYQLLHLQRVQQVDAEYRR